MTSAVDGSDDELRLRIRDTVDTQYILIIGLLVLLMTAGLWVSYTTHVSPETQTETEVVSQWSRTATFDHGATVTGENPVYDTGQRLQNQRAYFPLISPVLSGEYQLQYAASGNGNIDIDVRLQSTVQGRSDGTVFWQRTRDVGSVTTADVEPGGTATTDFEFDMNQTRVQLERVEETFGETPGDPVVIVRAQTRLTGRVNGQPINREFTDELRLIPDGDAFVVNDPGEVTNTSRQTRTSTTTREYSSARRFGGPAVLLFSIAGLGGLVVARRRGRIALSPAERDQLVHSEYSEWISVGSLSTQPDLADSNVIEMSSLVDLINVAADAGERVVYDPDRERYAVFNGGQMYVCEPPLG
ncbi:hypothetical protein EXE46_15135 [Halorubrum sp. GN11_10-6_MGM]|uniref:DUF5305 domain-containing protein n=1 Tax=Halorubrum sp. GN11_10-6_MGM TaxID=2518112 RepID=UPI0010F7F9E8|nr:DUF5305 domain-containing protein [Halorubrum sp. GN11_10-6_MGM]TKX72916.1 hypothetical protein EXE46_15135 [Halorubrum sp. GN11_10-6_MGM]